MKSAGARTVARPNQNAEGNQAYFDENFAEITKEKGTKECIYDLHVTIKK